MNPLLAMRFPRTIFQAWFDELYLVCFITAACYTNHRLEHCRLIGIPISIFNIILSVDFLLWEIDNLHENLHTGYFCHWCPNSSYAPTADESNTTIQVLANAFCFFGLDIGHYRCWPGCSSYHQTEEIDIQSADTRSPIYEQRKAWLDPRDPLRCIHGNAYCKILRGKSTWRNQLNQEIFGHPSHVVWRAVFTSWSKISTFPSRSLHELKSCGRIFYHMC